MMDIDIKELIKAAAEGLDLSNFKGDVVGVKVVENEIGNVEEGGIGVQKVYSSMDSKRTADKRGKSTSCGVASQQEKQHGVEYPVFSKGSGVTEDHVRALYRLLATRGWISTQTKEVDFLRLFNGEDNDCEIVWTGQDKLGSNEATHLGVPALYVLFKKMADEGLITSGRQAVRVGPILESHFVDAEGHFLAKVSNVRTTSRKANDYINRMLATMRMRPSSEDIQSLLQEEMESKLDKYDRQDIGYRKPR